MTPPPMVPPVLKWYSVFPLLASIARKSLFRSPVNRTPPEVTVMPPTSGAGHGRLGVEVRTRRDGQLVQHIVAVAVQQAQHAVLAGDREQVARLAFHGGAEQRADLAQIPVVGIARNELAVPQQLAGPNIEG